jgi:hypothetical protein
MTDPIPTAPYVLEPLAPLTAPGGYLPATNKGVVTKSNSTVFGVPTRALWVGGAGDVAVTLGGQTVILTNVPAGTMLNIAVTQVRNTGTSATLIVALN